MKKILFLIHDLSGGGAEKVLVNLIRYLDREKYHITVMTLFDEGIHRKDLPPDVVYRWCLPYMFRGNSHALKLCSPKRLHDLWIREHYDIEVAYLEGPCTRVISGCQDPDVRLVAWIHREQRTRRRIAQGFCSYKEAVRCYGKFDQIACVSRSVQEDFARLMPGGLPGGVWYNTNDSRQIREQAKERADTIFSSEQIKIIGIGKLLKSKGFDRLIRITARLCREGCSLHLYLLGEGPERKALEREVRRLGITKNVTLTGYCVNPYPYLAESDIFVCASYAEGFSTAATEALILGTAVCSVDVAGMREMLGSKDEYGVVTANEEEALYQAVRELVIHQEKREYYQRKAKERGERFCTQATVWAVEAMFDALGERSQ